jgi:hypothetical protein
VVVVTETMKVILLVCGAGVVAAFLIAAFAMFAGARVTMPPEVEYEDLAPDPPTAPLAIAASPLQAGWRVPPYITPNLDPDLTAPLEAWEQPKKPTTYQGGLR